MAEACRRFPLPSPDEAAHALRELSWGEHFVAGRMVPSKGGSDLYLYNLHSAAVFLLDRDEARVGKGADQIIKLIDVDAFVAWLRDTVGDAALADVRPTSPTATAWRTCSGCSRCAWSSTGPRATR